MTNTFPYIPAIWSYGLAGLVFVTFAGMMIFRWRGGTNALVLFCSIVFSAWWAFSVFAVLLSQNSELWRMAAIADAARISGWLAFLTLLVDGGKSEARFPALSFQRLKYFAVPAGLLLVSGLIPPALPWLEATAGVGGAGAFYALLAVSIFGLVLCEQLYQRTPKNRRWAIKPLIIGLAGMFAFDLLIYSGAILFHQIDPAMWAARGIANALVIVLVGVATARNTAWTVEVLVSRDVVYQ